MREGDVAIQANKAAASGFVGYGVPTAQQADKVLEGLVRRIMSEAKEIQGITECTCEALHRLVDPRPEKEGIVGGEDRAPDSPSIEGQLNAILRELRRVRTLAQNNINRLNSAA